MSFTTNSIYMAMPIPVPGLEQGPQYALDIDNCLLILDQHDHSSGKGVQITPSGLSITSDLPLQNNNLTQVRSVRFQPQIVPIPAIAPDLACFDVSGVDLYFNDGAGNVIRMTQSGAVAGAPGSIANLVSPASAAYSSISKTFIWQSDATTPANMDFASAIFRNLTPGSFGVTVSAPAALGADYALVLPALPASQNFMTLDAAGNMAAPWHVDNSTLAIVGSNVQVKDQGVTPAKLAPINKVSAASNSGSLVSSATTFIDIPSQFLTIVTSGRPVQLGFAETVGSIQSISLEVAGSGNNTAHVVIQYERDDGAGYNAIGSQSYAGFGGAKISWPAGGFTFVDFTAPAGSHTYRARIREDDSVGTYTIIDITMYAMEF